MSPGQGLRPSRIRSGSCGKSRITGLRPLKPPVEHFLKACVIVWAVYSLDLEPAVCLFYRLEIAEHHHGPYRVHSVGVGYVIGFHPVISSLSVDNMADKPFYQGIFFFSGRFSACHQGSYSISAVSLTAMSSRAFFGSSLGT